MARTAANDARDPWLPVAEAVEETGIPRRTLYRWVKAGLVSSRVERRRTLVRVADVLAHASRPLRATVAQPSPELREIRDQLSVIKIALGMLDEIRVETDARLEALEGQIEAPPERPS